MWFFDRIPYRLRNKVVNEWRGGNKVYVKQVVKEFNVFMGTCDGCLGEQLKEWITWAIEDDDGPLNGHGD